MSIHLNVKPAERERGRRGVARVSPAPLPLALSSREVPSVGRSGMRGYCESCGCKPKDCQCETKP